MSTVTDTAPRDLGREDLQLVAEGDKRAFARLYDAWAPTLFALIRCVLKDRAQAEEVLQDTFLHVWRRAPSYDPGRGSVRAWLTTIARRRAIDRVRSAQAARDRELASPPDVDWDQTAEEAESRIAGGDVRRALSSLGEPHKTVILLSYFGGLSHSRIADATGLPLGTVKSTIRQALARLHTFLEER